MRTNSNDPQDQEATAAWYQSESEKQLNELLALQGKMARALRKKGVPAGDEEEEDAAIQGSGAKKRKPAIEGDEEEGEQSSDDYNEGDEKEKGIMGIITKPIKKLIGKAAMNPADEEMDGEMSSDDYNEDEEAVEPTDEELAASQRNRARKGGSQQGMGRPGEKGMPMARNKRNIIEGGRSGDMGGDNGKHPDEPMSRDELMKKLFAGKKKPNTGQVSRANNGNNGRGGMKPDVKRPKPKGY